LYIGLELKPLDIKLDQILVTAQLISPIDFHSIEKEKKKYCGTTFFKIYSIVFCSRKKCIQVWNKLTVSK